jgi:hypothetical protein
VAFQTLKLRRVCLKATQEGRDGTTFGELGEDTLNKTRSVPDEPPYEIDIGT